MENHFANGPLLGKVTDNQDPDNLAKVKVLLSTMGESIQTDWIPVMSMYATNKCGSLFIPEVDDQVLVAFIGDNPNRGVVLGSVWNETNLPPETGENTASDLNKDGENNLRFIKSRSGHMIIFDDKSGEEKLQIINADAKTRFEFLTKDKLLSIKTDKGFVLSAKGGISIKAKECKFVITKGLKIEAGDIELKSTSKDVKIKASNSIALEGGTIKLN